MNRKDNKKNKKNKKNANKSDARSFSDLKDLNLEELTTDKTIDWKFPELVALVKEKNISFEEFDKECTNKVFEVIGKLIFPEDNQEMLKGLKEETETMIKALDKKIEKMDLKLKDLKEKLPIEDSSASPRASKDCGTQTSPK